MGSALDIAANFVDASRLNLAEERAEIVLRVRSAYYQALLASEAASIAQEALDQAERFLAEEPLRFETGRSAELDVLRAEVARDNIRPQVVEARNAEDLAMLDLKRLVDVPLDRELRLTTPLEPPPMAPAGPEMSAEAVVSNRAAVLAAERQVSIARRQVSLARASFLPEVSLSSAWGQQLFPEDVLDLGGNWRSDWTVSLNVRVPIFTGMRRVAEVNRAQIQLRQAKLQLAQLRESVLLQHRQARGERERALEAVAARQGTAKMAERVYDLTVLRYDEGQATQLEVQQARLDVLQGPHDPRSGDHGLLSRRCRADAGPDAGRRASGPTDFPEQEQPPEPMHSESNQEARGDRLLRGMLCS